jgi:hypothetical protein
VIHPDTTTGYNAGLGNLKICIESRLENAGATIKGVSHPGWPASGSPPECLEIRVTPVDCPTMAAVFSLEEIAACHKGVTCQNVSDRINLIVDEYIDYRARSASGQWSVEDVSPDPAG